MSTAKPESTLRPNLTDETPAFTPLYRQIKALMTRDLQAGVWRPGEAIASEKDLAVRFRVSQGTVRKAIDALADDNLLVRRQGKGTFVATHSEVQVQYRFLRLQSDDGDGHRMQRRLIDCRHLPADAEVAAALGLKGGEAAVRVRRVLSFRGQPVVFDDIWLPGKLFQGLSARHLVDYRGPLYGLFESEFGVRMIRAQERIRAVAASAEVAAHLGVAEGAPLLSVERLSMTYGDAPVELRRGLYNTTAHHYRNDLN
jgi:GntR family transcriptional regulator